MGSALLRYYEGLKIAASIENQLLFDAFGIGLAGFSFRLLNSAYTGYCIKVRRSSDDVTSNIGFINGYLNTDDLYLFLGEYSGYVERWYNQDGSGIDFIQTTTTAQPRIWNAGTLDTENGKACLVFSGSQFMSAGDNFGVDIGRNIGGQYVDGYLSTILGKMNAGSQTFFAKTVYTSASNRIALVDFGDTYLSMLTYNSVTLTTPNTTTRNLYNFKNEYYNDPCNELYKNGSIASSSAATLIGINSYRYLLGAYNNATDTGEMLFLNGTIQEHHIYRVFLTEALPSVADINTNINSYYSMN